jgi:hypothetical protein
LIWTLIGSVATARCTLPWRWVLGCRDYVPDDRQRHRRTKFHSCDTALNTAMDASISCIPPPGTSPRDGTELIGRDAGFISLAPVWQRSGRDPDPGNF